MIDFGDSTWYCHWDKSRICKRQFRCDGCKHQPADDDKENGRAEPAHIRWVEDYDGSKIPECPSCGQMPYNLDRCIFCGQRLLPDETVKEWDEPAEEERMDCLNCGGEGTIVGTRAKSNGHFHGQCTACGCVVIE